MMTAQKFFPHIVTIRTKVNVSITDGNSSWDRMMWNDNEIYCVLLRDIRNIQPSVDLLCPRREKAKGVKQQGLQTDKCLNDEGVWEQ